jgi:RNA polymerase sigma factor (sigma-70 family)
MSPLDEQGQAAPIATEEDSTHGFARDVVVRFVAGDRNAFTVVFDKMKHDLFYVVRRFFRGAFDQEEALQEVWLHLYRVRHRFDVNRFNEFSPWVRQVARNRCIDLLKEKSRTLEIPVQEIDASIEPPQDAQLAETKRRRVLAEFVSKLDGEEQRFFELCFILELTHEEIAERMSASIRRSKYLKKKLLERMMKSHLLRGMEEA